MKNKPQKIYKLQQMYKISFCYFLGSTVSPQILEDVIERKTPQEVLHDQNEEMSQDPEKVSVQLSLSFHKEFVKLARDCG